MIGHSRDFDCCPVVRAEKSWLWHTTTPRGISASYHAKAGNIGVLISIAPLTQLTGPERVAARVMELFSTRRRWELENGQSQFSGVAAKTEHRGRCHV